MRYVVGVDGGGTKTEAWLAAWDGAVLARIRGGGANPNVIGVEEAAATVASVVDAARAKARLEGGPQAVAVGLAGASLPSVRQALRDALAGRLGGSRLLVHHDAFCALAASTGGRAGAVLIAGTGSVAYGRDEEGGEALVGGWGHLFGDEGSGFAIGRAALQAAARAWDGRGPETALAGRILRELGLETARELTRRLYVERPWSVPQVAALAPWVAEEAEAGDETAARILEEAAGDLTAHLAALLNALRYRTAPVLVGLSGGLMTPGSLLRSLVEKRLAAMETPVQIAERPMPPAAGAAAEALKLAGRPLDEAVLGRLRRDMVQ